MVAQQVLPGWWCTRHIQLLPATPLVPVPCQQRHALGHGCPCCQLLADRLNLAQQRYVHRAVPAATSTNVTACVTVLYICVTAFVTAPSVKPIVCTLERGTQGTRPGMPLSSLMALAPASRLTTARMLSQPPNTPLHPMPTASAGCCHQHHIGQRAEQTAD